MQVSSPDKSHAARLWPVRISLLQHCLQPVPHLAQFRREQPLQQAHGEIGGSQQHGPAKQALYKPAI